MKRYNLLGLVTQIRYTLYGAAVIVACTACENFVDIPGPAAELPANVVYEDVATADAALAHIYSSLQSKALVTGSGSGMGILMGTYSDELISYSNYGLPEEKFFTNNLQANDATVASIWADSYNLVYASNAILEGTQASQTLQQDDKDRLQGEALFLRSYIYSYLVQLFGDIPYVTTTDYTVNMSLAKLPVAVIYSRLIDDLATAEGLLGESYTGNGRVRPNKYTAAALLARVCLTAGEYELASEKASQVINNAALFSLSADLNEVFLIDSPGTIWQLMPAAANLNTLEGQNYIFSSGPPSTRALSQSLIDSFEPGDLRLVHWVGSVTEGGEQWYYPFKYKQSEPTEASLEYSVQLRLEEMFLLRAEARTRTGDLIGAKEDLNAIRERAGLSPIGADGTASLLDAILQERRVELFSELGHRFFDLKRLGVADTVLSMQKPGWNEFDISLPLPERELRLNPNLLPQNTGY